MKIEIHATINDDGTCQGHFSAFTEQRGYEVVVNDLLAIDFNAFMANVADTINEYRKQNDSLP